MRPKNSNKFPGDGGGGGEQSLGSLGLEHPLSLFRSYWNSSELNGL